MLRNVVFGIFVIGSLAVSAATAQVAQQSRMVRGGANDRDLRDLSRNGFTINGAGATCATAPVGLVSAYSGDGNALDARSRNNGTIQNNVTFGAGNIGQAFQLGGNGNASNSGDRVIVGSPANLRLQTFTFEAWVKRSSSAILTNSPVAGFVNGTIFAFGASGWGVVIDGPTNRLAFTQVGVNNIQSNLTITDINWHHIAVSISGSQAVFYLDGVADTPIGYTATFVLTTNAAIGARGDNDARNAFFGAIDELAIYNRVLSATEVAALFNAGTVGKCKPLATVAPENQVLCLRAAATLSIRQATATMALCRREQVMCMARSDKDSNLTRAVVLPAAVLLQSRTRRA